MSNNRTALLTEVLKCSKHNEVIRFGCKLKAIAKIWSFQSSDLNRMHTCVYHHFTSVNPPISPAVGTSHHPLLYFLTPHCLVSGVRRLQDPFTHWRGRHNPISCLLRRSKVRHFNRQVHRHDRLLLWRLEIALDLCKPHTIHKGQWCWKHCFQDLQYP